MKCEYCGGTLSLEEEHCPHCGQINIHAQQHIQDMKHYKGEFEKTKWGVYAATKQYTRVTVQIVVIAIMVVLIAVMIFVSGNAYSMRADYRRSKAERKVEEYTQVMEQYIADEDFRGLHMYCEENYIGEYREGYEEYGPIIRTTSYYTYICDTLWKMIQSEGEERLSHLHFVCEYLNCFYESSDLDIYHYEITDPERTKAVISVMERDLKRFLQTYCNLTQEEVDGLKDMTEAKRTVLIEERGSNEE